MTEPAYEGWAVLELMGHRQRPGYVREVEIAGGKLLRVDIHGKDDAVVTEFYGTAAIYCLRPVSEEIARDLGGDRDLRPIRPVAYRERDKLPLPPQYVDDNDDEGPNF